MTEPGAIGYLRRDISGSREEWDKAQIRRLAARFGYDLRKILAFDPQTDRPIHRLSVALTRTRAESLFTPSAEHFDGHIPAELVQLADVVTVNDGHTYARWATGELPELNGA